jgi:D-alanyl-D-alanine endopeptidase (penicillin-binding protein 7)
MRRALFLLVSASLAFGLMAGTVEAAPKKKVVATKRVVVANKSVTTKRVVVAKRYRTKLTAKPALVHRHSTEVAFEAMGRDPALRSASVLVIDQSNGAVLFEKNADAQLPIASISKLMTAMVVLDAKPDMNEVLTISQDDLDLVKGTHSRLKVGTRLTREEMLRLALMSSENRAAAALSRYYVGGSDAFVAAMNQKAAALGLSDTRFEDPTGLTAANVSSARDLTRLVSAAHGYPLIREYSTTAEHQVMIAGRPRAFHNTNSLVRSDGWEIGLSKTGYISEAGKCLVMQAWLNNKPLIIVLLDSWGRQTRIGDANRLKRWIESASLLQRPASG